MSNPFEKLKSALREVIQAPPLDTKEIMYAISDLHERLTKLEQEFHTCVWDRQVAEKQAKAVRIDKKDGKK